MLHASACEQDFPDELAVTGDDLRNEGFDTRRTSAAPRIGFHRYVSAENCMF
jgi:hypothetical protein